MEDVVDAGQGPPDGVGAGKVGITTKSTSAACEAKRVRSCWDLGLAAHTEAHTVARRQRSCHDVRADEASGAGDEDQSLCHLIIKCGRQAKGECNGEPGKGIAACNGGSWGIK